MTDTQQPEEETTGSQDATPNQWDAIAKDFQALGQSISDAVKGALQDENYKQQLADLGTGMHKMADQVTKAVDEAIKSPAAAEAKTEVKRAAGEVKDLGGKVYADTKPHLINILQTVGEGIQTMIDHLEAASKAKPESDIPTDEA